MTGKQIVLFGLWRDPSGTCGDSVLFDSKLTADPQAIDQRYSTRRSIELTFRETKQLLGATDSQCRKEDSVKRSVMLAYWAYCFVAMWFLENFRQGKRVFTTYRPWYRQKKIISFQYTPATARRSHFTVAFLRDTAQITDFWEIECAQL